MMYPGAIAKPAAATIAPLNDTSAADAPCEARHSGHAIATNAMTTDPKSINQPSFRALFNTNSLGFLISVVKRFSDMMEWS